MQQHHSFFGFDNILLPQKMWLSIIDKQTFNIVRLIGDDNFFAQYPSAKKENNLLDWVNEYGHPKEKETIIEIFASIKKEKNHCRSGIFRIKCVRDQWLWFYLRTGIVDKNLLSTCLLIEINDDVENNIQFATLIKEFNKFRNREKIKLLTRRELTVIKLIAEGNSYSDIARQLYIQPDTVNSHRKNILRKLGVKNIAMLVCFAKETGLV